MGTYDTQELPIYRYLHGKHAPKYTIADRFFQSAFGGSFLNHQWLIAARSPLDTDPTATYTAGGPPARNSVLDANGMPTSYPQYTATGAVVDDRLTQKCADPTVNSVRKACGDFAVNTIQPGAAPHGTGQYLPLIDDTKYPNIGDRLSAKGITWNWVLRPAGTTPSPATPARSSSTTTSRSTTSPPTPPGSPGART